MLPDRTFFSRPDTLDHTLYVVTTVFNPARFRTRWKLYQDFAHWVSQSPCVKLITVEVVFGNRQPAIPAGPDVVHLHTTHELWLKERALKLAVQRIPDPHWRNVAWLDADVEIVRPDWADETRHQLEHHSVVQLFSQAQDLGPHHEILGTHRGFVDHWLNGGDPDPCGGGYGIARGRFNGALWHPGFAWAMRREAWDGLGGIYDTAIVGSADSYMAWALIGRVQELFARQSIDQFHPAYQKQILDWQERATFAVQRNLGCVSGLLLHKFHGSKKKRNYIGRNDVLIRSQFDPTRDIMEDWQGLWQLTPPTGDDRLRRIQLRDDLRAYARSRDEDSTEV